MSQPVKRLGSVLGVRGITVRFPQRLRGLISSPKRPAHLWGQPSIILNWYRDMSPRAGGGGKERQGRKVNHLPPPSAEVKNEWS
jgi:hypothetical protein